jgi:hypothetical protein
MVATSIVETVLLACYDTREAIYEFLEEKMHRKDFVNKRQ